MSLKLNFCTNSLGTLNCVGELPGSSNKTRLYKLNEVRALAIAVHGLDRYVFGCFLCSQGLLKKSSCTDVILLSAVF